MTRYKTLVSCALVLSTFAQAQGNWASLQGRFTYGDNDSDIPPQIKLKPDKDIEVCGKNNLFDESLMVHAKNRGLANVVIWAYKPNSVHPGYVATKDDIIRIKNLQCRFEPHVTAVRTSQTLEITNPDPVGHNALLTFFKNPQVNPLIPPNGNVRLKLVKPELLPIPLSCAIHPWMRGIVLVQDHPYMSITDANGDFELKHLPEGKVTLKVWHERVGYIQSVQIDGKNTAWKKGKYVLDLKSGAKRKHKYRVNPKLFSKK